MTHSDRFLPSTVAVVFALWMALPAAGQNCATPGQDGPNPNLSGIVNTYYPGVDGTTLAAGATSIPVGAPVGGQAIAADNLLLVIQMQDADIDSTDTDSYGDGV